MSESKHTLDEWSVDDYGAGQRIVVKGRKGFSGDYRIADAHFSSTLANCASVLEMQANARLISAAPNMYEALIQARGALRLDHMVNEKGEPYGTTTVALDRISAALAKADGSPS